MIVRSRTIRTREIERSVKELLPEVTLNDFEQIIKIGQKGHLRHLPPSIIAWQSITSHVRHNHTEYDQLLLEGYDAEAARHFVIEEMNQILEQWGSTRFIDPAIEELT